MITLIGSSETGLAIMREAATSIKKFSFELGGNAPVVVMDDADPDAVVANLIAKKCGFAGQTCVNYNRIYVHEKIYEQVIECTKKRLADVVPGRWKDPGNVIGPMINKEARDRMFRLIEDAVAKGASLLSGGTIPEGFEAGCYITPALLRDVTDDMRVSTEEFSGPSFPFSPSRTWTRQFPKPTTPFTACLLISSGIVPRISPRPFRASRRGKSSSTAPAAPSSRPIRAPSSRVSGWINPCGLWRSTLT